MIFTEISNEELEKFNKITMNVIFSLNQLNIVKWQTAMV